VGKEAGPKRALVDVFAEDDGDDPACMICSL
jgi:hypothetical protein